MSKISAKDATVLINGYKLSTFTTAYEATAGVDPIEVTGFGDGSHNSIPGQKIASLSCDMLWSSTAGDVHTALGAVTTGQVTIIPEAYVLGCPSFSMPFMQENYNPGGDPGSAIKVGSIKFNSKGDDAALFFGIALQNGTITNTLTGASVLDPTNAAQTAACGAVLHVWQATAADTYVIKVQHSANDSTWADLLTFTATGAALLAERQVAASGTINKYRRILATRTGSAGNTLGFSVHFFIKN
jgi:hypothetical protein